MPPHACPMGEPLDVNVNLIYLDSRMTEVQESRRLYTITELAAHEHDPHYNSITDGGHGVWTSSEEVLIRDDVWVTSVAVKVNNADSSVLHHAPLAILRGPGAAGTRCGGNREFFIFA